MQVKTRVKAELIPSTYPETQVQVKSQPKGGLKVKTNIKAGLSIKSLPHLPRNQLRVSV